MNGISSTANGAVHGVNGSERPNGHMEDAPLPEFDSIPAVVAAIANNEFVIVLDSPSRENEGDLIIAASSLTPSKAAFMIRYTSGYLCAPITSSRCLTLQLPQMYENNQDPNSTAYTVSIDAQAPEITTGISASDRSLTCRMLAEPGSTATSFRRPGHIIPLRARDGGVRERRGHTEAAVDLCRLAGKQPVGVIGELVTDGEIVEGVPEFQGAGMMRTKECLEFGRRWGIKVCTIEAMVEYLEKEGIVLGRDEGKDGLRRE